MHDFAFFDLWSKPLGLLFLLQELRDAGRSVSFVDCIHEAAAGDKKFGIEKISKFEIRKPTVYAGIKRHYYSGPLVKDQNIPEIRRTMLLSFQFPVHRLLTEWYL